jgi:DNA-binding transcriptional ArsR family regulator
MAKSSVDDAVFHALANEHRRHIVRSLAEGPRTVGQLTHQLGVSMATVSKHLTVLERARLLDRATQGRSRVCTLRPEALDEAQRWIHETSSLWNANLDRLAAHLAEHRDESAGPTNGVTS